MIGKRSTAAKKRRLNSCAVTPARATSWAVRKRFLRLTMPTTKPFIADEMLEQLPAPAQVGKTKVGGIDLNKPRMRWVAEAIIALSPSPGGFTASELARQVQMLSNQIESEYGARRAAYDLKKLRGKQIVRRIGQTRRYESIAEGAESDDRAGGSQRQSDQALAGRHAGTTAVTRRAEPPTARYALRHDPLGHARCFSGVGTGRVNIDNSFVGLRP